MYDLTYFNYTDMTDIELHCPIFNFILITEVKGSCFTSILLLL